MRGSGPFCEQEAADSVSTALRELQVVGIRSHTIGMAFDHHLTLRILLQEGDQRIEIAQRSSAEVRLARLKEDIAQREHQAAVGLPCLQGGEFLL